MNTQTQCASGGYPSHWHEHLGFDWALELTMSKETRDKSCRLLSSDVYWQVQMSSVPDEVLPDYGRRDNFFSSPIEKEALMNVQGNHEHKIIIHFRDLFPLFHRVKSAEICQSLI